MAALLVALLRFESEAWNVPLGPPTLDLRPPSVDDAPMACGTPGDDATAALPGSEPRP
jgi:hypothetical protein